MKHEDFKISKESVDKLFPKHDIDILGYESPINVVMGQMRMEQEDNILKVVQEQGVSVDKDELIKALKYDRDQYEKGYVNGYNAKASEVAREIFEEIEENLNNLIRYYKEKRKYVTEVEYSEFEQRYCDIKIRTFEERLLKMSKLKKKYIEEENHI